jgi:hypothetical protein
MAFALPTLLGGIVLAVEPAASTKEQDAESLRLFNNLLVLWRKLPVAWTPKKAVYGAIDGMLGRWTLTPGFLNPAGPA